MDNEISAYIPAAEDESSSVEMFEMLKPSKFDVSNFKGIRNKSEEVLEKLLDIQDNDSPLKKGGNEVAFRCDVLILKNRQHYTADENNLFDIISGVVSTSPDDESYIIRPADVKKYFSYESPRYVSTMLSKATESLKQKNALSFEVVDAEGKIGEMTFPWFDALYYVSEKNDENGPYIIFTPTPFFKILLISATITHGAFYKISVSSKIQSRYSKALFYILESRKNYKESVNSAPGVFQISLVNFQKLIDYPDSYKPADIKRRILEPAKQDINSIPECDIQFEFKMIKTKPSPNERPVATHIEFTVISKANLEEKESELLEDNTPLEPSDPDHTTVVNILKTVDMTDKERELVIAKYYENKRDLNFLMTAIVKVNNDTSVKSKAAVLQRIMEDGNVWEVEKKPKKSSSKSGSYANMAQHDYDIDAFEKLYSGNYNPEDKDDLVARACGDTPKKTS